MSKTKSNYVLQSAEKSHCPKCGSEVDLLCEKDFDGPAFYICFNCKVIGHVGKGPVKMVDRQRYGKVGRMELYVEIVQYPGRESTLRHVCWIIYVAFQIKYLNTSLRRISNVCL